MMPDSLPTRPIVTLTTDWGWRDFFVGRVKGYLLSAIPGVEIVDIAHDLDPYTITRAAFVVTHACLGFPPGTIHIIDVCSSQTAQSPFVVVQYRQQYFICTDNGLPSLVFRDDPGLLDHTVIIDKIPFDSPANTFTFAACDLFCSVAALLVRGAHLSDIGFPPDSLRKVTMQENIVTPNGVDVKVTYIDRYGNIYLNITYDEFERLRAGRSFRLLFNGEYISEIDYDYVNHSKGHYPVMLTVSSTGLLEIAVYRNSAERVSNLAFLDTVRVLFG